jgi:hypothetical protein
MKKIFTLLFMLSLVSCKKEKLENSIVKDPYREFYGNWVGDFRASVSDTTGNFDYSYKINIVIKKIEKDNVFGQSIIAGKCRSLKGKFFKTEDGFKFILIEMGDNINDGKFEFNIDNNILKGNWFSNDKNQHVTQRTFELKKQKFKYNPKVMLPANEDGYVDYYNFKRDTIHPESIDSLEIEENYYEETYRSATDIITKLNSSTTKLTESELKNLKKLELEILRNTIYARHGYAFNKKTYRQFFDAVEWYIPVSRNVDSELTSLEKANIKILERFEKYAEDNYDSFGR